MWSICTYPFCPKHNVIQQNLFIFERKKTVKLIINVCVLDINGVVFLFRGMYVYMFSLCSTYHDLSSCCDFVLQAYLKENNISIYISRSSESIRSFFKSIFLFFDLIEKLTLYKASITSRFPKKSNLITVIVVGEMIWLLLLYYPSIFSS
jgi:hypothetical protein